MLPVASSFYSPGISNHPPPHYRSAPHAPCNCVRALLLTSLANLGLRTAIIGIFTKEDEDRRLLHASPATVCNLVNQEPPRYSSL